MGGNDFKHIVKGDIGFTTAPRTGLDPTAALEAASAGAAPSPDALVQGGSIKLEAIQKVDIAAAPTDFPKVPGTPLGGVVSIVSDRINTTARVDYVERIGPVSVPLPAQIIGLKTTQVMSALPAGGIFENVLGVGNITRTIVGEGNIVDLATLGTVTYTAGVGAASLVALVGAANVTASGAATVSAGGIATVTATGALVLVGGTTASLAATAATTITGLTISLNG